MLITSSASKFFKRKSSITLNGKLLDLTNPVVMGILNVSPDSFFDGGKYTSTDAVIARAEQMVEEGADIIDVGAVSTRPGAENISTKEELTRLLPAVTEIRKRFPEIPMSIDTYRSWVALRVIDEIGECIVNDISGGSFDEHMFDTIAKLGVPYILMHIHGNQTNMHETPHYDDIIKDISKYFSDKVRKLTKAGVKDVILDPGFGFGKNIDDNYDLLNRLDAFKVFQLPVLVGVSRKSMLHKMLEITPEDSLPATIAANTMALLGGADILRVHDVKEAVHSVKLFKKLKEVAK
ncbi:dihydropteroate synthase [Mangrovibacterium lignilyticum]|uniref:dihydropteroate synthase n=1 Tax=Mangrovibacterium lignilyticum TaxID=2668052 RepID=UPI0013D2C41E|nr:dihydropteroate synthase [Mangrovibacterium lignilyticum]